MLQTFKREDVPSHLMKGTCFYYLTASLVVDWAVVLICWWPMVNTSPYLYPLWGLIVAGRIHAFGVSFMS